MKILTIVGARPQFVKASVVSRELRKRHCEVLVHTGQHYDDRMSAIFFRELDIPPPDYDLEIGSGPHGWQTAGMLSAIEEVMMAEKPDCALVYGDTNSTLAGALAAAKLHIPVVHIEAGLRSWNRRMPEEINRVLTDHVSTLLLCPSQRAADNLSREGVTNGVHVVGDVMCDALLYAREKPGTDILDRLGLAAGNYFLATVHRAENTDMPDRFNGIFTALCQLSETVLLPAHPRIGTRLAQWKYQHSASAHLRIVEPLGYLDMVTVMASAKAILTDSGGMQKEAYWLGVPCITLRDETEWTETVEVGWNVLAGAKTERIVDAVRHLEVPRLHPMLYGDGKTSKTISETMGKSFL